MLYHLPGGSDLWWSLPWGSYPRSPIVLHSDEFPQRDDGSDCQEPARPAPFLLAFRPVVERRDRALGRTVVVAGGRV